MIISISPFFSFNNVSFLSLADCRREIFPILIAVDENLLINDF